MKLSFVIAFMAAALAVFQGKAACQEVEGWAGCTSVYPGTDRYELNGGGEGSMTVLRSDGSDMRQKIEEAVKGYDVIVFDGCDGDFVLSRYISFYSLKGKTLVGVNGACLRTEFAVTDEIRHLMDSLNVNSLSQSPGDNLGGTLSNGVAITEQRELAVRQALIDFFGDETEPYRNSGIFHFWYCENIILRNLDFAGPGSIDVGGADLVTLNGCQHVWLDHCRFTDGMDGNVDIINNSDFVTVSDTHFRYTGQSYNHQLSNLNSGALLTDGSPQKNNISWIRCFWDEGCTGRMPWTAYGIHHVLNCYWDCSNSTCVDVHDVSKVLIENSMFTYRVKRALAIRSEEAQYEWRGSVWNTRQSPESNAEVNVPYTYAVSDVKEVPEIAKRAGVSAEPFKRSLTAAPAALDLGDVYAGHAVDAVFNLSAYGFDVPDQVVVTAPEGVSLSLDRDGEFSSTLRVDASENNLLLADIYVKAEFETADGHEKSINVLAGSESFDIPLRANVVVLNGEGVETTLTWTLDGGSSNPAEAATNMPDVFDLATLALGEKIYIHSTHKVGEDKTFTYFNPTEAIERNVDEECRVVFKVSARPGCVFVPSKVRLNAARVGTNMCLIDVVCRRGAGEGRLLLASFQPERSSDIQAYSEIELPINNVGVGDNLEIVIYLYYMSANKQLALNDVVIEGMSYRAETNIAEAVAEKASGKVEYYDLQGRRAAHPRAGAPYLKHGEDGSARVVICR